MTIEEAGGLPPLIAPIPAGEPEPPLSQAEEGLLRERLWRLLEKRVKYMTMGDSSSIRIELAEELQASILFTLSLHMRLTGMSYRALLGSDIDETFKRAVESLEELTALTKRLYERVLELPPPVPNRSYMDTIAGIGAFFRRYDARLMSRDIPCDIDYQLCLPVPDGMAGVEYVYEYLRRLYIEQSLVARLDCGLVARLLDRYCPDPAGLLINMYEPTLANATGAALAGLGARGLNVPRDASARLAAELARAGDGETAARLNDAALKVCSALDITAREERKYLIESANALLPRIKTAAQNGSLSRVFIAL